MNSVIEYTPEKRQPALGSFLVYILPVIVGEVIVGTVRGDMAFGPGMLPSLAMWGLAGRIQAAP